VSRLYLVPTPIGNLEDMTFRAVKVLQAVDLILAEDTRTSGRLLRHFDINRPVRAYHMHNEHRIAEQLAQEMARGAQMALITDAGTPGLSDPGFLLVRACAAQGLEVQSLPGASALLPALGNSALPAHRFAFEGFLPPKKGRQKRLMALAEEERTLVFYESPHRLVRSLSDLMEHFGPERPASISREISKLYEETIRGSLSDLHHHFSQNPPKGEFVLCVGGKD